MTNWEYAKLTSDARQNGGPVQYIEKIERGGYVKGQESMYPVILIACVAGAFVSKVVYPFGISIFHKGKELYLRNKQIKVEGEEAKRAYMNTELSDDSEMDEMKDNE